MEKFKQNFIRFWVYTLLVIFSLLMLVPFFWMLITSLKSHTETLKFPPNLIPKLKYYINIEGEDVEIEVPADFKKYTKEQDIEITVAIGKHRGEKIIVKKSEIKKKRFLWENYVSAWKSAPFGLYFYNNTLMAVLATLGQIITSALAAYAFARLNFPLKNTLFMILLATLMVPGQVRLIPNYILLAKIGWINTYYALIVPWIASVFGVYFMKQFFETLPQDLFDAAMIDGCSQLQSLIKIALPLSKSVVITTGLFTFISQWNSLLWPLIVTNSPEMRTIQVGLTVFKDEFGTNPTLLMAASSFSLAPLVLIFFIAQKQFIQGVAKSGLKG